LEGAQALPQPLIDQFLIYAPPYWYLKRCWAWEERFYKHYQRIQENPPSLPWNPHLEGLPLNEGQKEAIHKAASLPLTLITGGPGTGKTYTAACLIKKYLEEVGGEVAVAAPTGKAAAALREALPIKTETLHALLHVGQRRGIRELGADLVLVDEGSMVDAELMGLLFASLKQGARLVILGDPFQLPPVGSGHLFSDIGKNKKIIAELIQCMRAERAEILILSERVKRGEAIVYEKLPSPQEIAEEIAGEIPWERELSERYLFQKRFLTPLRQGPYGVVALNQLIYEKQSRRAKRAALSEYAIPIMITGNSSKHGLFNGDVGYFVGERGYFSHNREIALERIPPYEYAYVLSVHKSQGSEYESVRVLLPQGSENFGRELLYTAITRAKKEVRVAAEEGMVEKLLSSCKERLSRFSASE